MEIQDEKVVKKVEVLDKPKEDNKKSIVVSLSHKGFFEFTNQNELKSAAEMMIKTSLAPNHLKKEGYEAVAAALVLCKQYNLPQKAMNQMAFVEGKITCYGSLVTALAERHPEYGERKIFYIDKNCEKISWENKNLNNDVWGCVILNKKKNSQEWNEFSFTRKDAELAGLDKPMRWDKKTNKKVINEHSAWSKYFRDMIFHKCNKRCLEHEYASALEGILYYEDVKEALVEKDVTPKTNTAALELTDQLDLTS